MHKVNDDERPSPKIFSLVGIKSHLVCGEYSRPNEHIRRPKFIIRSVEDKQGQDSKQEGKEVKGVQ